ncbi:hypothetical protein Tco_0184984 [Tanacetum coccineum]
MTRRHEESTREYRVREHIGLKILSWKKVNKESIDKLWDEITRYFDVDLTVRNLEKSARGKMTRSKNVYHHKMGGGGYVFVKEKMIENKEIEAYEDLPRGIMWLKGKVNKDGEFTDDKIRSVGDKLLCLVRKREVMQEEWEVELHTRGIFIFFEADKQLMKELSYQTQLDNERRERQQKDELVKKLSTEMTEKDVTPMGAYEVDGTQSSVFVRDKDVRIKKKSNGLVTSEKEPVKTVGPKKTPKLRRNGSQDSQSQGNASKCKLCNLKKSNIVALGTVYKSTGKQMLHNQALPNDCYKVPIDSSLVDATCIPDVGNNGLKTVKDGAGGFFAWPKNQVVLDEEPSFQYYRDLFTCVGSEDLFPDQQDRGHKSTQSYVVVRASVILVYPGLSVHDFKFKDCLKTLVVGLEGDLAIPLEGDLTIPLEGDLTIPLEGDLTIPLEGDLTIPLEGDLTIPLEGELTIPLECDLTIPLEGELAIFLWKAI